MLASIEEIATNAKIPTPPAVAVRLLELIGDPDVTVGDLIDVLQVDPKLTGRLIGYTNSPIVGARNEVTSLQQCITLLGLRTVRLLSLSFSLVEMNGDDFDYPGFWRSSLATALASKHVASRTPLSEDTAFLFGLTCNVGIVGVAIAIPNEVSRLGISTSFSLLPCEEEQASLPNRYEVGSSLLRHWGFPPGIVEALKSFDVISQNDTNKVPVASLHLAQLLLHEQVTSDQIDTAKRKLLEAIGPQTEFPDLFDDLAVEWHAYEGLFDSAPGEAVNAHDLEARAREYMMQISLSMENEIQSISHLNKELERTATIDKLTGLKNRASFDTESAATFEYLSRQERPIAIAVIDIDHFKSINDTHGHAVGDSVLSAVGHCLSNICRKYDGVYRYGGEEFVAVLQDCKQSGMASVAERIRDAIEACDVETSVGTIKVTVSIGIQWVENAASTDLESLFQRADQDLYTAKRLGRNRVVLNGEAIKKRSTLLV